MKRSLFLLLLLLLLLQSVACISTRTASLRPQRGAALALYMTQLPAKPYEELCYIQADGSLLSTPQQLLKALEKKALELDAQAVIQIRYSFQGIYPVISGVAVRYVGGE